MNLRISRKEFSELSTIGDLTIDDQWHAYTLEDVVRPDGVKIPGKTAIPAGRYEVVIDPSVRFKRAMPHILNVPLFEGIRIHAGNTAEDTEGCPLLGLTKAKDFVGRSRDAFNTFMPLLEQGLRAGKVWITIENSTENKEG